MLVADISFETIDHTTRPQRAVQMCAEERERDAELIAARKVLRSAALAVATAFVKQHLPRSDRLDTFRKVMKIDQVKYLSRTEKTTRVHEALWWMSYNCRFCGVGKWYVIVGTRPPLASVGGIGHRSGWRASGRRETTPRGGACD